MRDDDVGTPSFSAVEQWTSGQRAEVARMLDSLVARPKATGATRRRRVTVLLVTIGGAVALLPWVTYLSVTLPASANGGAWRTAWIGFDVILAGTLGLAGWLVWTRRQLAVVALPVGATLLMIDAWFDVTLSWGTAEQWGAVATAIFGELPVAAVLVIGTVTVLSRSAAVVQELRGQGGAQTSLWRQPLVMVPTRDLD